MPGQERVGPLALQARIVDPVERSGVASEELLRGSIIHACLVAAGTASLGQEVVDERAVDALEGQLLP